MKIYCATTNPGKLREFRLAAGSGIEIEATGFGTIAAPEETGATFAENAALKAAYYSRFVDGLLFAEDSGLEVRALGGAPGIYSARWAGSDAANNHRLMAEMGRNPEDRAARYVCVIAVAQQGEVLASFEGTVEGEIAASPRGDGGFGYDPLFWYPPFGATFAEVTTERKFEVSHRRKALDRLFEWLASERGRDTASR
jgi:XTP/dITP diphosphohydrolase